MTTRSDPQRRRTVIDLLAGVREYVYPVGRLDYDTEGLLLLTNDGDLAARLTHPRHGVERTYEASVAGMPDRRGARAAADGHSARRPSHAAGRRDAAERRATRSATGVLRLTIREGRNRQVRRMCEAVGHPVRHLKRTKFGSLPIALKPREWRELDAAGSTEALQVEGSKVKVRK